MEARDGPLVVDWLRASPNDHWTFVVAAHASRVVPHTTRHWRCRAVAIAPRLNKITNCRPVCHTSYENTMYPSLSALAIDKS